MDDKYREIPIYHLNLSKFFNKETSNYDFSKVQIHLTDAYKDNKDHIEIINKVFGCDEFQIEIRKDGVLYATLKTNKAISPIPIYIKGVEPDKPKSRHISGSSSEVGIGSDSPFAVGGDTTVTVKLILGKGIEG